MNQQELLEKLKTDGHLMSKSQRKHLKKVIKNRGKKEKRIEKQRLEQESSQKLIEENHNGGDYSEAFITKASDYYMNYIYNNLQELNDDPNRYLYSFQKIREKLQTLLLKWPETIFRNQYFWYFKILLDTYRDNKGNGEYLLSETKKYLKLMFNYGN